MIKGINIIQYFLSFLYQHDSMFAEGFESFNLSLSTLH